MKIGIFGGSFDPVHYGHLILAEQCREQADLDRVLFVPATVSPLKTNGPTAADKHRMAMLSLAIAGHANFEISTAEIDRGGTSYTVDTLNMFQSEYPDDELFLMMGQDSLETFDQWKSPDEILSLASLLVVRRPGSATETLCLDILKPLANEKTLEATRNNTIESRLIDISSTEIRHRNKNGRSIRYLLPRSVEKYIETNKLYS